MAGTLWTFIAVHFWAVIGTLGALSTVLLIVAFICCGWQIGTVLTAMLNLARVAISFFETPLGEVIAIILLMCAVAFVVDVHQIRVDDAAYKVKLTADLNAAAKVAADDRKARDDYVKQQISADADKRVADITAEKTALEQKASDYETALTNTPNAGCIVGPDDVAGGVRK